MRSKPYVSVNENIASAILEREGAKPVSVSRNSDNSFTATFNENAEDVRQKLEASKDLLVVMDPGTEDSDTSDMSSIIRFAFVAQPKAIG